MARPPDSRVQLPSSSTMGSRAAAAGFQREYARWLGRVEQLAILPMKWGILALCAFYWMWMRDWALPENGPFALFFLYGGFTASLHYLFARDRVSIRQMRPVVHVSYFIDLLFVTGLVYLDLRGPAQVLGAAAAGSDYYVLYLLLIFRGFALFRTPLENMLVAALISVLFLVSFLWVGSTLSQFDARGVILRLALIWGTMLLATFIVNVVSRQQEEVLRVRERLLKAEGLAALGELAAGVAHEINNPIGIIKTYADYLKRSVSPEDPHHEDYETIRTEAERCEVIVRRMLDFANPNVRALEPIDLPHLVEEVLAFVFHERGEDAPQTELLVEGRIPPVRADATQIKQALLNVVMNARQMVKDMPRRGEVTVRVRQLPGPRAPVEIAIHDNGPGISPEDARRAFEPFYTKRDGGTGLGLAITRRIVEAHDGSVDLWPAADGGTTCTIVLPIAEEG